MSRKANSFDVFLLGGHTHKFDLLRLERSCTSLQFICAASFETTDNIMIDYNFLLFGFNFSDQDNVSNVDQIARRKEMEILLRKFRRFE